MSYKSIALFRKKSEAEEKSEHANQNAEFLCLKGADWYFWEHSNNSIGGGFSRSGFEKALSDYFDYDFKDINFRYVGSNEYEGKDNPANTAYVIEVNTDLVEGLKRFQQ